jgi:hypothetical protein
LGILCCRDVDLAACFRHGLINPAPHPDHAVSRSNPTTDSRQFRISRLQLERRPPCPRIS